jgi:hypothetical protein
MFEESFLKALADWQRGWGVNQEEKNVLASKLKEEAKKIDEKHRKVSLPCFRKRFLHKGELINIIMIDKKEEGVASWTTKKEFAEIFRGLTADGAVTGAIFEHIPEDNEVIVNICSLWSDADFIKAADSYQKKCPSEAEPLFNFKEKQGEVVLESLLRGSEIIALTGASSPFDDLCDVIGIHDSKRSEIFTKLLDGGVYPGELQYTSKDSSQSVIANVVKKMNEKLDSILNQMSS